MEEGYKLHKNKRNKRRAKRQAVLGPERVIVATDNGVHRLSCGHFVRVHPTELPQIKRWRCARCLEEGSGCRGPGSGQSGEELVSELNEWLAPICDDGLPFFCSACGAGRSLVPVTDEPGVLGECRECHAKVLDRRAS